MPQQQMTAAEQEELRKKLENMTPEQLRDFQKKQCVFCHIVNGRVAAKKVFEDSTVLAVLDINPANPGHLLLMPKEHYTIMPQLPDDVLQHIFIVAKQLSNALLKALDVRGTNIIVANGPAAGQRAQHFMIHIIPRKNGDGIEFSLPTIKYTEAELDRIADSARKRLNEIMGINEVEETQTAADILKPKVVDADFKEKSEEDVLDALKGKNEEPEADYSDDDSSEEDESDKDDEESDKDEDSDDAGDSDKDDKSDDEDKKEESEDESIDLDSISRIING